MLYQAVHREALARPATLERLRRLHEKGAVVFEQICSDEELKASGNPFQTACFNLAVIAPSVREARARLLSVCEELGLETEESLARILPKHFVGRPQT